MSEGKAVVYTAKNHTVGGRDGGSSRSSDGRLDVRFSTPGSVGAGTNPEQLFAAGWSTCFLGAMGRVARNMQVALPADTAIDAEIDLCAVDDGFVLQARLNVSIPGLDAAKSRALVDAAHQVCPYSKATHGNIDVTIEVV